MHDESNFSAKNMANKSCMTEKTNKKDKKVIVKSSVDEMAG